MTTTEIITALSAFPSEQPVWFYDPHDEGEMYQTIGGIETSFAGDINIYRDQDTPRTMTVAELILDLKCYPADMPVWMYDSSDDGEPYKEIASVEYGPFQDLAFFWKS